MSAEDDASVPGPERVEREDASVGTGEESQPIAEPQVHKEETVIDVHAPHGGLHTWKDFWIHLGTITLGLLIAISLEQSVEWLHHLNQRHQLEADLHAEAEKNLAIMDDNYRFFDLLMANVAANRDRVDAMRAGGGKMKLPYLPFKNPHANGVGVTSPLASVWTTAKESELVGLLPRDEAKFYDRVYRQYDLFQEFMERQQEVAGELASFDLQFAATPKNPWDPTYPDFSRMSPEQLDQEAVLLAKLWHADRAVRGRLDFFYAAESAVLQGGAHDEDVISHFARRPVTPQPAQPDATAAGSNAQKPEKP